MKIAKVYSRVLSKALESKKFWGLSLYVGDFPKTEDGCFVSRVVNYGGKPTLNLKLALEDYFFNEHKESDGLFDFAEGITGKKEVDLKCLKVVEL